MTFFFKDRETNTEVDRVKERFFIQLMDWFILKLLAEVGVGSVWKSGAGNSVLG